MRPSSKFLPYILPAIVFLCSLVFFLGAVEVFNGSVAVYHDAMWDFIPAVAMIRGKSLEPSYEVQWFHHSIPILTSPYSGALKVWLLAPLVKILPLSPRVILILNVLFGLIYLMALYWALVPLVGSIWASAVLALPFLDTNFLITVPVDTGINLTQYILISLAAGALFRYMSDPQLRHMRAAYFLGGCVLFQKLTAFPIVIGLMVVLAALSLPRFLETVRTGGVRRAVVAYLLTPAALFITPLGYYVYYFWRYGFTELNKSTAGGAWRPYFTAIASNFTQFFTSFDGWDWYRRLTLDDRRGLIKTPYLAVFALSFIALSLAVYLFSRRGRATGRNSALCIATCTLGFLLYPAFRGLYRPWHLTVLEPLFLCCFVVAAHHSVLWAGERFKGVARGAAIAVLTFLVSTSTLQSFEVLKRMGSRKGICMTSPAFYCLYDSIVRSRFRSVYAINYSMAYPIYVLSKGTVRVVELAWADLSNERVEELIRNVKRDPDAAIVYRYCACKDSEPTWIEWLNRETELPGLIKRLADPELRSVRFRDDRQTEFVLVSQKGRPVT